MYIIGVSVLINTESTIKGKTYVIILINNNNFSFIDIFYISINFKYKPSNGKHISTIVSYKYIVI